MLSYRLKCRKKPQKVEKTKVLKTKNERIMLLSKFWVCNSKKLKFLREQEVKRLLSNLTSVKV